MELLAVVETAAVATAVVAVIETGGTFTATMTVEVAKVEKAETKVVVPQTPQSLWAACPSMSQRTICIESFQRLARWSVSGSSWIRKPASPKVSDLSILGRHRIAIMQFLA